MGKLHESWWDLAPYITLATQEQVVLLPGNKRLRDKAPDWLVWQGRNLAYDGMPVWPRHQLAARGIAPYCNQDLNTEFFLGKNYDVRKVIPPLLAAARASLGL